MSVCLEGFGWSEEFTLPLPPPPTPPPSLSSETTSEDGAVAGGEHRVHGNIRHPRPSNGAETIDSDIDTDAEIAAAVGGGGAMMNAGTRPALPPSPPPWVNSERLRWRKCLGEGTEKGAADKGGGGEEEEEEQQQHQKETSVVSVVVAVGLKGSGLGQGPLRINAEVAFSACGRREVCFRVCCDLG